MLLVGFGGMRLCELFLRICDPEAFEADENYFLYRAALRQRQPGVVPRRGAARLGADQTQVLGHLPRIPLPRHEVHLLVMVDSNLLITKES